MKKTLGLFALLVSASASAQPCVTHSNGLFFFNASHDTNHSSSMAVESCQKAEPTSNYECQQNLRCGFNVRNPFPSGNVSCTTSSNHLHFVSVTGDTLSAVTNALNQCKANPYTQNYECQRNVRCEDAGPMIPADRVTTCTTHSNRLTFTQTSSDINVASSNAVQQCEANRYTQNYACRQNLTCTTQAVSRPAPVVVPGVGPRPTRPAPVVVPTTPVYGDSACVMTTPSGRTFPGSGMTREAAMMNARRNCVQSRLETPFTCNRTGVFRWIR